MVYLGLDFHITLAMKGTSGKNSIRGLEAGRDWSRGHGGKLRLAGFCCSETNPMACSSFFLIYRATSWQGTVLLTVAWGIPHQSSKEKMPLQALSYRPIWWGHFLSWSVFSSDDISLYQIDKTLTNISNNAYNCYLECLRCDGYYALTGKWKHRSW